jgi:SAM-dependent methyltransferase
MHMHSSAYDIGKQFLERYCSAENCRVLDVGSYDVNGSLRQCIGQNIDYVGADLESGPGVDVVIDTPDVLPFENGAFDAVISTSTYEHAAEFWMLLLECARVTRPGGHIYINAPSNGVFHQFPFDYWRFYPDAGIAFVEWIRKNGHPISLIESGIAPQMPDQWNDFVAVLQKSDCPQWQAGFITDADGFRNVRQHDKPGLLRHLAATEDQLQRAALERDLTSARAELTRTHAELTLLRPEMTRMQAELAEARGNCALLKAKLKASRRIFRRAAQKLAAAPFAVSRRIRDLASAVRR